MAARDDGVRIVGFALQKRFVRFPLRADRRRLAKDDGVRLAAQCVAIDALIIKSEPLNLFTQNTEVADCTHPINYRLA